MSNKAMKSSTHLTEAPQAARDLSLQAAALPATAAASPRYLDSILPTFSFKESLRQFKAALLPKRRAFGAGSLALAVVLGLNLPSTAKAQVALDETQLPRASETEELPVIQLDPEQQDHAQQGQLQGLEVDGSYTIQRGDTLWDLSETYLNNPWYWPRIWAENPYIENPHWIYPGDPLLFPRDSSGQGQEPQTEVEAEVPEQPLRQAVREIPDVSFGTVDEADNLGRGDDLVSISQGKRLGFDPSRKGTHVQVSSLLSPKELEASGTIVGSFQERALLSTFDQVYIRFDNLDSVRVGDRFNIFRPGQQLVHPKTRKVQGVMTTVVGNLHIVGKDAGVAVAQIDSVLDYAERGDRVGTATTLVRDMEPVPNEASAEGFIIGTHISNQMQIGDFHLVYLDLGQKQGLKIGNTLEVVHSGDGLGQVLNRKDQGMREPQEVVAQLIVFDVREETSAAMVLRSVRETQIGDRVRMVAQPEVASVR